MSAALEGEARVAFDDARELADAIERKHVEYLRSQIRIASPTAVHASAIGERCERRLYLSQIEPEHAAAHDETLESIFHEGRLHERAVITLLNELGMRVLAEQQTKRSHAYAISGTPEGLIMWNGVRILAEVKSVASWNWDTFTDAASLREHRSSIVQKWFAQVQVYLLMMDLEAGVLIAKNKQTGMLKAIPIPLDYEVAEKLLDKAARVKVAVEAKEPPPIPDDLAPCATCPFRGRACFPPIGTEDGAAILVDDDLIEAARIYHETKPIVRQHETAKKRLVDAAAKRAMVLVGDDTIMTTVERKRKEYTVAAATYHVTTIKKLGGAEDDE